MYETEITRITETAIMSKACQLIEVEYRFIQEVEE